MGKVSEDCPEMCRTTLSPPTCGPSTRSGRIPFPAPASPDCSTDQDCQQEEQQCFPRQGTNQCIEPTEYMKLEFDTGAPCSSEADCPEACWNSGVCGPYLIRRMGTKSPETGGPMDTIPPKPPSRG